MDYPKERLIPGILIAVAVLGIIAAAFVTPIQSAGVVTVLIVYALLVAFSVDGNRCLDDLGRVVLWARGRRTGFGRCPIRPVHLLL